MNDLYTETLFDKRYVVSDVDSLCTYNAYVAGPEGKWTCLNF